MLYQLLETFRDSEITVLEKAREKARVLVDRTNGKVEVVIGSLDDIDIIERECLHSDIIVNAASGHYNAALRTVKKVLISKSSKTLFMHISGTSVLSDSLDPEHQQPDKIYSDVEDIEEINSLDDSQPYRLGEKLVLSIENLNREYAKTVIISPPLVFGLSRSFFNKLSVQIPCLIRGAVSIGHSFTVYSGETRWDHVHVYDVGRLYTLIITRFLNGVPFRSGYYGYYFLEDGSDLYWRDVSIKVSEALYRRGLIGSRIIKRLTPDQVGDLLHLPPLLWGTNCRSRADVAREIGWVPARSTDQEFWNDIDNSIDFMLENNIIGVRGR